MADIIHNPVKAILRIILLDVKYCHNGPGCIFGAQAVRPPTIWGEAQGAAGLDYIQIEGSPLEPGLSAVSTDFLLSSGVLQQMRLRRAGKVHLDRTHLLTLGSQVVHRSFNGIAD